ncbi:uncharacterized protein LOC131631870 [Vicia villosa]|uniref:uncharacterized protein LOC131631870 n=1 Tax=Vicia villosa TaxID=3911 RepID=UPI00273ADC5A|nr:uncharacterized protein LOC131631870 [Vicia villosa]
MLVHTFLLIYKVAPIKYIFEKSALSGQVSRWQMILTEYDIQYVTQKAIKGSVLSDYLAHHPVDDYQPMKFEFLDQDIMCIRNDWMSGPEPGSKWTFVFDGASNELGHGIGAVITSPTSFHIPFTARICFDCNNNVAEYEACIFGIQVAINLRIKILKVYGDSALVICQVNGDWETRHENLIPYRDYILELIPFFDKITFNYIPREEKQLEDALATLSSLLKVSWTNDAPRITIERLDEIAHYETTYSYAIDEADDEKPWFYDIKRYVESQEYSKDVSVTDKKTLRKLATKFFLSGRVLYKRNYDSMLLRCVDRHEVVKIIAETYEKAFGKHSSGHPMVKKILRAGYYWSTMDSNCCDYAKTCHKCQV